VRADLEQVLRTAYPRVVAVAARVLGSRDEAEDDAVALPGLFALVRTLRPRLGETVQTLTGRLITLRSKVRVLPGGSTPSTP